jgi:hypothetical protein
MAEEVTTELRVGKASLKRDLDDAKREFARFRRDIEREAATIRVNSGGFGAPRAGGGGGDAGGDGVRGISRFTRGVGSAVSSLVVAEGLIESGAVAAQALGATADLMKGNTRAAVDKLADAGEEAKKLPLLGNIARPLERFLGFITGINQQIAQLERETKEMDAKTARMAKKNEAIRGANAKFEGIIGAGQVASATEAGGPAAGRLIEVRRQIKELDALVKSTPGADKDKAKAARDALVAEENRLKAEVADTQEKNEREHQNKLTEIMAEGNADRLRAAADEAATEEEKRRLDREADRAELADRQRRVREAITTGAIGGTPEESRRAQEKLAALKPTQEAERAEQEAKFGREDRERQEKEAERQKKEFGKLMDKLESDAADANRLEEAAYDQVFRDQMRRLHEKPIGGGFITPGEQYGSHLQSAILSSRTGTEAGTVRAAAEELRKAAEKMASLPLIGVVSSI